MSRLLLGGRYRLEEELARGGTATVWRARDQRLDRPVAVKLLTATRSTDPRMLERLRREARTLAGLTHPNIVSLYDLAIEGSRAYLVMELVEGQSMAARLAGGPLPIARAAGIAAQTCAALAAAHAVGVIHRDVKPANIMLTGGDAVKVVDFGIARLQAAGQATLTSTSQVLGTSLYMAPELATGAPADPRSDLYALGCTLYAMLAGVLPFTGVDPLDVLNQHLHQQPRPLRAHRADVPPDLDRLVSELLDKDPARRPANADAVGDRLAAVADQARVAETRGSSAHPQDTAVQLVGTRFQAAGQPTQALREAAMLADTADLTGARRRPASPSLYQRFRPRTSHHPIAG